MKHVYHILGIAPYEGMASLMESIAIEYPQIALSTMIGQSAAELGLTAKDIQHDFDIVISRGGAAITIRELSVPVIDIGISLYDILSTLKLANGFHQRTALVSMADMAEKGKQLVELLDLNMDVYVVPSEDSINSVLDQVQTIGYDVLLCDMITNNYAQMKGLNSFHITSGVESVRNAIERAIYFCDCQQQLKNTVSFFRELLDYHGRDTVVLSGAGEVIYSSISEITPQLLTLLKNEIPETSDIGNRNIIRSISHTVYTIQTRQLQMNTTTQYVFLVSTKKRVLNPAKKTITFYSFKEITEKIMSNIVSYSGYLNMYCDTIDRLINDFTPVVICGEEGTEPTSLAEYLYLKRRQEKIPVIEINCLCQDEKSWHYLLENSNSPLFGESLCIILYNVNYLSMDAAATLMQAISYSETFKRNHLIISAVCDSMGKLPATATLFANHLSCPVIMMQPLRKLKKRIPVFANQCIAHNNGMFPQQILGIDGEGISFLQGFSWPGNFIQFKRIIINLAITSNSKFITAKSVKKILNQEHLSSEPDLSTSEEELHQINLRRDLHSITCDIAKYVVDAYNGNQTKAAISLGISRTTLWKLLKQS